MKKFESGLWMVVIGVFATLATLRLVGIISWSWWWITSPLWGMLAAVLIIIGVTAEVVGLKLLLFIHRYGVEELRRCLNNRI